jgi:NitT/TauT family transport system permease protein
MSTTTEVTRPGFDDGSLAVLDPESRRAARRRKAVVRVVQIGLFIAVFGGWELFTRWGIVDSFFFGSPSGIVDQLVTWAKSGTDAGSLWEQIGVTLEEALLGFVIGVALGVGVGVSLGRSKLLSDVFAPYIKAVNAIPRIVLGSVFVVALGLGIASKVALAVVLVFFVVFFNAFQGTREVDRNLIANARILGASRAQVTRQVVLPSALTWIMASLHTSFGFALIGAIVGEFLGAEKGLGLLVSQARGNFNIDGIFAAMLIMAAIALIAESVISLLERRLLSWRPPQLHGTDTAT